MALTSIDATEARAHTNLDVGDDGGGGVNASANPDVDTSAEAESNEGAVLMSVRSGPVNIDAGTPSGKIQVGAIQAISSSATTMLALEVAFLGYWAFGSDTSRNPWVLAHLLALVPMAVAFVYLTRVPLAATDIYLNVVTFNRVRRMYQVGMRWMGIGVAIALLLSIGRVLDALTAVLNRYI